MRKIVILPNPYRDRGLFEARRIEQLLRKNGFETRICMPFAYDGKAYLPKDIRLSELGESIAGAYMLICLGGDGTILHASRISAQNNVPILGVNMGNKGFMANLEREDIPLLEGLGREELTLESRMMLDVSLWRRGEKTAGELTLNDALVKSTVGKMIPLTIRSDGMSALEFKGDGVIAATPTGSTAYSMSAGGPIVEPEAENIIITPICAHALYIRPYVLAGSREVEVIVGRLSGGKTAFLSTDGGQPIPLRTGDIIKIKKSEHKIRLVKLKKTSFFDSVVSKLNG